METTNNPLDKMLKEQLDNYCPEPPAHVLSQLKLSLQLQPKVGSIAKVVTSVKKASLLLKLSTLIGLVGSVVLVQFYKNETNPQSVQNNSIAKVQLPKTEKANSVREQNQSTTKQGAQTKLPEQKVAIAVISSNNHLDHNLVSSSSIDNIKQTTVDNLELQVLQHEDFAKENNVIETAPQISNSSIETTEVFKEIEPLVIPNAFSPNADGLNDEFEIVLGPTQFFRLRIYHLNGSLLFETTQPTNHWKGNIQESGQQVEVGNYRYVLEYQLKEQVKPSMAVGYIYLNR